MRFLGHVISTQMCQCYCWEIFLFHHGVYVNINAKYLFGTSYICFNLILDTLIFLLGLMRQRFFFFSFFFLWDPYHLFSLLIFIVVTKTMKAVLSFELDMNMICKKNI